MRLAGTAVVALALAAFPLPLAPAAAASPSADSTYGFWRSDGYGAVLKVDAAGLSEYQTTSVSCLMGDHAVPDGGGRYVGDSDTYVLRPTARPDRLTLHIEGDVGDRTLHRVRTAPPLCTEPSSDNPLHTFDVFWQTFAENYPFFAAKGVNWQAVRETYRPRVHSTTSDAELFAILRDMVAPLYDAHVALIAGPGRIFAQGRPGTTVPNQALDDKVRAYIESRDLGGRPLREFAGGKVGFAELPDGKGYLRISSFTHYTDADTYAADSVELGRALDAVLTEDQVRRLRGLIIDLRVNGGGSDALGLQIAARLTDHPYLAYTKRARNNPKDPSRFTVPQPLYVHPAAAPRYTGSVTVLTSGSTVSAGETFTQALMNRPGGTTRIGQPTQGVFSDVLTRTLPNGWQTWLPNEEYLNHTGTTYDGPGIPPDITVPVFTEEEFERRRDSAFDRAVEGMGGWR